MELPGTPWSADFATDGRASGAPFAAPWRLTPGVVEQAFTHFVLQLNVYVARLPGNPPAQDGCFWVAADALDDVGFSSLMRKAVAHGLKYCA